MVKPQIKGWEIFSPFMRGIAKSKAKDVGTGKNEKYINTIVHSKDYVSSEDNATSNVESLKGREKYRKRN